MLIAITHKPSPHLNNCELTHLQPQKIDINKASSQHKKYCQTLTDLGVKVITLDENLSMPDCAFIEDTAIVLDEIAVITPMGITSRQGETELVEKELAKFRPIAKIKSPAKIEGGDILKIGKKLYVGLSTRTNLKGINALEKIAKPFGYEIFPVKIYNSLHLKTACTALDNETILVNSEWIDTDCLGNFKKIRISKEEPFAANILRVENKICVHSEFNKTNKILEDSGYEMVRADISEFLKAEAGLTCLSLIFME